MQSVAPQNHHAISVAEEFLHVHWDRQKPLLLAYSGGGDSKALLYALLECQVFPHLVHIDHGWRKESADEAQEVEEEAKRIGCKLFRTRLEMKDPNEDEARRLRYEYFASIYEGHSALLLAHHADDLAETVLKRIFEGAHLWNLGGMEEVSKGFGMNLWRPFLTLKKSELKEFLKGVDYIEDPSNRDPIYLRSRLRLEILPFLEEKFGKKIGENLVLLSKRAGELKKDLDERCQKVAIQKGAWGVLVDLNGLQKIEMMYLIQKISKKYSLNISRKVLETLIIWTQSQDRGKKLSVQSNKIFVDEGRIWFDIKRLC